MLYCGEHGAAHSIRLVPDECNNHAVEVEEEHDKMEAELDK